MAVDYYLQQKIDSIRYYADQQIAEVNRRAAEEIRVLVSSYNTQIQSEVEQSLQQWAY